MNVGERLFRLATDELDESDKVKDWTSSHRSLQHAGWKADSR
jgi:hypothetical protein